jgi:DNA-directed RNA polymerase specialized sigma24 family protein
MNSLDACAQEIVDKMIHLGRYHAVREGVPQSDVDDCELTFVENMLLSGANWASPTAKPCDTWLHRCAQNHARNFRRSVVRRDRRFVSLGAHHLRSLREGLIDAETPESLLLRKHVRKSIDGAVAQLVPEVRSMLYSHHVQGNSAPEIALQSGRTTRAVEQALYRARRSVKSQLSRQGFDALDGWNEIT